MVMANPKSLAGGYLRSLPGTLAFWGRTGPSWSWSRTPRSCTQLSLCGYGGRLYAFESRTSDLSSRVG